MKNKGFTLVELVTTFALTAVIIVLLINVVVAIKNTYSNTNMKTELYINQSNLSNALNSKINNNKLVSYESCTDTSFCYIFNFSDSESIKLKVSDDNITFGDFTYKLMNRSQVKQPTLKEETVSILDSVRNNSFLTIKIPIECELYPNMDFGINLVYQYNTNITDLQV